MQPTYYERLLADRNSPLAEVLDEDIAKLKGRGRIIPNPEDAEFAGSLGNYLKRALEAFKSSLAQETSAYQFELFQQTPAYQEAMVQMAGNQYWTYESFFYFKALGEQTVRVSSDTCRELLQAPLPGTGADLRLANPALMLVFEAHEMIDALYAGERRQAPGRSDYAAPVYVFVVEVPPSEGFKYRRLKLLSAHSGPHAHHRIEVRRLLLQDDLSLEEILKTDWAKVAKSQAETKRPEVTISAVKGPGASRAEDYGYLGARLPYYRAIVGALVRYTSSAPKPARPVAVAPSALVTRLKYSEL
jgi:hypothetical protein